jgi:fructose-1-phosphate kinase PfkB-like protein
VFNVSNVRNPGAHPEIYYKIIEIAKSKGSKIILDSDGAAMKMGMQISPDIIKPNVHELSRLTGLELTNIQEIISTAQTICDKGTATVLVSMGAYKVV